MNSDELYQEILLQHSRRPRNHGPLENPTHRADGHTALRALGAVHRFPQRVKCATLPWETLSAAIREGSVSPS